MKYIPDYDSFIKLLSFQKYSQNTPLENHHIIPRFEVNFGIEENVIYNKNNIITISSRHHTLAHYVRFKNFKRKGDKIAYLMRNGQTNKAISERKKLIIEINKTRKNLFWSSDWQRLQGSKGGFLGGLANTPSQYKSRQQTGLKYGRSTGIGNQSYFSGLFLKKPTVWQYKSGVLIVCVPVCESFVDIVRYINACVNEYNLFYLPFLKDKNNKIKTITNASCFAKVRDKKRTQLYGWSLLE